MEDVESTAVFVLVAMCKIEKTLMVARGNITDKFSFVNMNLTKRTYSEKNHESVMHHSEDGSH